MTFKVSSCAAEALNWTRSVMTRIGLTLNDAKTSIKPARREQFDFLGYSFGPHRLRKNGHVYLGASPSKQSVSKLRQKVGDLLVRQNVDPWTEVRDRLNRILRGWSNYFGYGTRLMAYRAVDQYVYERVGPSSGAVTRCLHAAAPPFRMRLCSGSWACCGCGMYTLGDFRELAVKSVGEPDARNGHVRFDERVVSRTRREARCCTKDEGRSFGAALWEE